MEVSQHIAAIGQEAELFAAAADQSTMDVPIDPCPGWAMRDLVRHLSEIHLWAGAHVAQRATKMWVDDLSDLSAYWPELAVFWPEDDDLVAFYLDTNANLVAELEAAPPDLEAMTFLPAPSPLAMWARRQAHETAIHRFDAQDAIGAFSGFDPSFASDGVDELLTAFAPRATAFPIAEPKAMVVHATDTGDRWRLTMGPDGIEAAREDGPADVTLAGRASDLYLAVWNRGDDSAIDVTGDRDVLDAWHTNHRIRWS